VLVADERQTVVDSSFGIGDIMLTELDETELDEKQAEDLFRRIYTAASAKDKDELNNLHRDAGTLDVIFNSVTPAGLLAYEGRFDAVEFLSQFDVINIDQIIQGCIWRLDRLLEGWPLKEFIAAHALVSDGLATGDITHQNSEQETNETIAKLVEFYALAGHHSMNQLLREIPNIFAFDADLMQSAIRGAARGQHTLLLVKLIDRFFLDKIDSLKIENLGLLKQPTAMLRLLFECSDEIREALIAKLEKQNLLPSDPNERKLFLTTGSELFRVKQQYNVGFEQAQFYKAIESAMQIESLLPVDPLCNIAAFLLLTQSMNEIDLRKGSEWQGVVTTSLECFKFKKTWLFGSNIFEQWQSSDEPIINKTLTLLEEVLKKLLPSNSWLNFWCTPELPENDARVAAQQVCSSTKENLASTTLPELLDELQAIPGIKEYPALLRAIRFAECEHQLNDREATIEEITDETEVEVSVSPAPAAV
jgi:hypothetical protein